jgi:hypothetical protein
MPKITSLKKEIIILLSTLEKRIDKKQQSMFKNCTSYIRHHGEWHEQGKQVH